MKLIVSEELKREERACGWMFAEKTPRKFNLGAAWHVWEGNSKPQ